MILNKTEVNKLFHAVNLEENYNFLEDDLVRLANVFADAGARHELKACVKVATDLNRVVGEKLAQVRSK